MIGVPFQKDDGEAEKGSVSQAKVNSTIGLNKEQLMQALEHLLRVTCSFFFFRHYLSVAPHFH